MPQKPFPLPQSSQHLLQFLTAKNGAGKRYFTTVDAAVQSNVRSIVEQHHQMLDANLVHNIAVLVVEVKSGNVLAYVGNTEDEQNRYSNQVDVIQARRSTGSILKPILYAASMQDGRCLPHALIADVPVQFDGFAPQNYSETLDGAGPASRALSRSLNIPAVLMLKDYGYPRFHYLLKQLQFKHIDKPADPYGLSLILGGAEASLWDITHTYAGLS